MMWQIFINGLEGKNHTIRLDSSHPEKTTVGDLKKEVERVTGVSPEYQRLQYGGKQLADGKKLEDYPPLGDGSTLHLVLRLPGGASCKVDRSLPLSKDPCMITACEGTDDEPVYKMPCHGEHPMSSDGLLNYCWNEIKGLKYDIKCPICGDEWSLDDIRRFGRASNMELKQLEIGFERNFCLKSTKIKQCPGCHCFCERLDEENACVQCVVCSKKKGNFHFCWHCLRKWQANLGASSCGNNGCNKGEQLSILKKSPKVKVDFMDIMIYKHRACPKCGTIIELSGGCKHMQCGACNQQFCFICLRMRMDGSWSCGSYNTKCELAPIQEELPSRT